MNYRLPLLFFAVLLPATTTSLQALGDLVVAPTRVVLEGRDRSAEISLIHRGSAPATYRIGFVELDMDEHGGVREREADSSSAAALIRFSPRQVTLEPGQVQTVRLQVRKPAELAAGEYRSHLTFRHVPDELPKTDAGGGLSVALVPVYGVSIPVIVRHTVTGPGKLEISSAALVALPADAAALPSAPPPARLQVTIHRAGDTSAYFDLEVERVGGKDEGVSLGRIRGLAIYTPNVRRVVEVPLTSSPTTGAVRVRLVDREDPSRRVIADQVITPRQKSGG